MKTVGWARKGKSVWIERDGDTYRLSMGTAGCHPFNRTHTGYRFTRQGAIRAAKRYVGWSN